MKGCNYIREQIDEAEKPDVFSFDVTQHLARCADCESFASERAGLRKLLASGPRVTAPMNFNAVLNARLAEAKGRRAFSWFSSPGYMRLGAATAALVVMVIGAQYAGLFSNQPNQKSDLQAKTEVPIPNNQPPEHATPTPSETLSDEISTAIAQRDLKSASTGPRSTRSGRMATAVSGTAMPVGYRIGDDDGVVLFRGQNGTADVPMPTVSVGAQPLLYVSAGQRQVRNVGASF